MSFKLKYVSSFPTKIVFLAGVFLGLSAISGCPEPRRNRSSP